MYKLNKSPQSPKSRRNISDEKLRKANRALKALIECNHAILKAKREEDLLDDLCWILVEVGGYAMAWFGFAQQKERKKILSVPKKGFEYSNLDLASIMWTNPDFDFSSVDKPLLSDEPTTTGKIVSESVYLPSRAEEIKRRCASYIAIPLVGKDQEYGALHIYARELDAFNTEEVELLTGLANSVAYGIEILRMRKGFSQVEKKIRQNAKKVQKTLEDTVKARASAVEARDSYTTGHQRRVSKLGSSIAKEMLLPKEQVEGIRIAGVIHDIGKIYVPPEILSKQSYLNEVELNIVKTHTQIGYDIVKPVKFPWPVADIILQHHERMNGSGYPSGLLEEEILVESKILGVADVVEAMFSHRSYRPARGINSALEEISRNKGTLYDPNTVDVCLKLFNKKSFKF
ncbi:MAG: HD-GYP domain-containing protein [Candidatus Aminicenantes bacterium]|nr:MAG: HD-GYP domain-containing protein [Candidatus Aminicenantes bacterium]